MGRMQIRKAHEEAAAQAQPVTVAEGVGVGVDKKHISGVEEIID